MKKVLNWLKKNWYATELSIVCFLIAIEVVPIWVAWGAIFIPAMIFVINKIRK